MASPCEDLILQARDGNVDLLTTLLKQHGPRVRKTISSEFPTRWQNVLSIDDVMQQSYMDAFLDIGRTGPDTQKAFPAWLTTLARHNLVDAVRALEAAKRGGGQKRIEEGTGDDSFVALFDMLGCSSTTPSREAARSEARTALEGAIKQLPQDQRRVVRMYDLECRPIEEVAEAFERSEGAVYMLRARAHRQLCAQLGAASLYLSGSG